MKWERRKRRHDILARHHKQWDFNYQSINKSNSNCIRNILFQSQQHLRLGVTGKRNGSPSLTVTSLDCSWSTCPRKIFHSFPAGSTIWA